MIESGGRILSGDDLAFFLSYWTPQQQLSSKYHIQKSKAKVQKNIYIYVP